MKGDSDGFLSLWGEGWKRSIMMKVGALTLRSILTYVIASVINRDILRKMFTL